MRNWCFEIVWARKYLWRKQCGFEIQITGRVQQYGVSCEKAGNKTPVLVNRVVARREYVRKKSCESKRAEEVEVGKRKLLAIVVKKTSPDQPY